MNRAPQTCPRCNSPSVSPCEDGCGLAVCNQCWMEFPMGYPKKPEEVEHPTQCDHHYFSDDDRLRAARFRDGRRFRIHGRPNKGPATWCLGKDTFGLDGIVFPQHEALARLNFLEGTGEAT